MPVTSICFFTQFEDQNVDEEEEEGRKIIDSQIHAGQQFTSCFSVQFVSRRREQLKETSVTFSIRYEEVLSFPDAV